MTEREKVIKGLECCTQPSCECTADCPYSNTKHVWMQCRDVLAADALALLKAQEPVKHVVDIDTWKCGNCGHALEHQQLLGDNVLFHEQYNYCPECGRPVDLDGVMFVPVVDEIHGGVTVEMKMTVGEFFARCCHGFEPEVVEAIPVKWIDGWRQDAIKRNDGLAKDMLDWLLGAWQKEQGAK